MSDDFLYEWRRPPHPEFAAQLLERLQRMQAGPVTRARGRVSAGRPAILVAIAAIAMLVLANVPPLRGAVRTLLQRIRVRHLSAIAFEMDVAHRDALFTAFPVLRCERFPVTARNCSQSSGIEL